MPIITLIKQQVKKETRVNVYLDNKFAFGIDLDNFVILGLKVGQELSDERVAEIVKEAEFQKTYEKILKFCLFRPRSEKEVKDWLKRKRVPEQIWADLIKKIGQVELLDDKKFAIWWVEHRSEYNPRSQRLLKLELQQKGIERQIISEVLGQERVDEVTVAVKLLERKQSLVSQLPDEKVKQKIIGFLARKGFSWEIIEAAIKKVTN